MWRSFVPSGSIGKRTWLGHEELSHFIWAGKEVRLNDAVPAAETLFAAMGEAAAPYVVRDANGQEGIQARVESLGG